MKIGIIGAGNVGGTLGTRLAQAGHDVQFGVRDPEGEKTTKLLSSIGDKAQASSIADCVSGNDLLILTLPWDAIPEVLQNNDLSGKVLLDATNPVGMGADIQKGLLVGHDTSGGEQVAGWAKGATVVKVFNSTGYPNMGNPEYHGKGATMFYCGNDDSAKATASQLGQDLGFTMIDAGPLSNARLIEPLAMLWIDLAVFRGQGFSFAMNLEQR